MKKNIFAIGIITLFVLSMVSSIVFGYNFKTANNEMIIDEYNFNAYFISEISNSEQHYVYKESNNYDNIETGEIINSEKSTQIVDSPIDSPWPMYCHDTRHTGRSSYSTVDTWDEVWRLHTEGSTSSPVIDDDGIIYVGSHDLQAVYPNGTLKWSCDVTGWIESCPAIDENGTLYVGTFYEHFYAINPDGTKKWIRSFEDGILSSPAIGNDGTIYFGNEVGYPLGGYINALYPNGTFRWRYKTNHVVYSSPAIGDDGTVYCGSHDTYLYALYPNNGTLKWRYKTGHWIRTAPCISDDGTIYVVSLDNYLHAVNPNGTMKWKTDVGAGTSPTIGQDGTIYCGYSKLCAINPNGSVKWKFNVYGNIKGSTPCHSLEDTIYFGTDGGWLYAVNSDGTLKWQEKIANEVIDSAPAIGNDGTVYIGSNNDRLYAFGIGPLGADAKGPYYGLIDEPVQFEGYSRGGYSPHSYHWDFGDTHTSEELNPLHTYTNPGNYTVTLTVTDNSGNTSNDIAWAWIQDGNSPPNIPVIDGETDGKEGTSYPYTFGSSDPEGLQVLYYIDWGDGSNTGWIGPYSSGEIITKSHKWTTPGTYTIKCKAKDPYDDEGPYGEFDVTITEKSKTMSSSLILLFLEQYPLLNRLLFLLIN